MFCQPANEKHGKHAEGRHGDPVDPGVVTREREPFSGRVDLDHAAPGPREPDRVATAAAGGVDHRQGRSADLREALELDVGPGHVDRLADL